MRILLSACFAAFLCACSPGGSSPSANDAAITENGVSISEPWAPPSPSGVDVGAGYLSITNATSSDDALIGVASPRAQSAEIHEMSSDGPVMRMRAVPRLAIPAGQTVTLGPGGMHLMFHGLDAPFAAGESVPVTLTFEHAGARDITLSVRARNNGHDDHG